MVKMESMAWMALTALMVLMALLVWMVWTAKRDLLVLLDQRVAVLKDQLDQSDRKDRQGILDE
jgi:F0F1-type ATP synthase membrane subunit b/b'